MVVAVSTARMQCRNVWLFEAGLAHELQLLDLTYQRERALMKPAGGAMAFHRISAKAASLLSPTHYLVAKAQILANQWLAGQAVLGGGKAAKASAGMAAVRYLTIVQCIAAKCPGGVTCDKQHPPTDSALSEVWWVTDDLCEGWTSDSTGDALKAVIRVIRAYLPLMVAQYGPEHKNVIKPQNF
jgi:hypothetical protein